MKLETFFEKFDEFADAPDAVAKMRELVLQLAVQGKLVPQDPNDEPASVLLERVRGARRRLADKGSLKTKVHIPEVEADDQLYTIPKTWLWVPLNELTELVYGKLLPTSDLLPTGFPVFGANGIIGCFSKYLYEDEMLLISCRGAYSGTPNISPPKCYVTNNSIVCEFFEPKACDIRFYHAVISVSPRERIVTGSAQPQVTVANAIKLPVPLPPLAEQKRIVAKVDELMALCDRLEAQQQERETRHAALARASLARFADAPTPANLPFLFHPSYAIPPADLRKSILTLAVQGKLVHRIKSEGLASDILERAGVSVEQPDDVPDLPAHWVWARLGSIATRMDSGWSPACIAEPSEDSEWGVLKTTAVQTLQYQEEQNKALPPSLEPRPEHEVMDGDILFTRAGPMNRVGILCVARPTRKKLMISDKIIRFHLVAGIDPDFAALSMNAGFSSTVVEGLKSGMAASQVNISQPKLRSVPIPIPPLAEQRRIVAKVEQLMALVDALEQQLAASRATGEKLLTALVAELTGGKETNAAA